MADIGKRGLRGVVSNRRDKASKAPWVIHAGNLNLSLLVLLTNQFIATQSQWNSQYRLILNMRAAVCRQMSLQRLNWSSTMRCIHGWYSLCEKATPKECGTVDACLRKPNIEIFVWHLKRRSRTRWCARWERRASWPTWDLWSIKRCEDRAGDTVVQAPFWGDASVHSSYIQSCTC